MLKVIIITPIAVGLLLWLLRHAYMAGYESAMMDAASQVLDTEEA